MQYSSDFNLFVAAAQAAIAELTNDSAKQWYSLKTQKDVQSTLDAALTVGTMLYQVSLAVYTLGALVGDTCFNAVSAAQPVKPKPCLPSPMAIGGYLPAAKVGTQQRTKPLITPNTAPIYAVIITPPGTKEAEQHRPRLELCTRDRLRHECRRRNIRYSVTDRKQDLINRLIYANNRLPSIYPDRIKSRSGRFVSVA